jgi:hypothetical protein
LLPGFIGCRHQENALLRVKAAAVEIAQPMLPR